jgi:hypothetical protein
LDDLELVNRLCAEELREPARSRRHGNHGRPEIELARLHGLLTGLPKDAAFKHERFGFGDLRLIDLAGLSSLEGLHVGGLSSE